MSNQSFDPTATRDDTSTKDVAADEAKNLASTAQQGGQQVTETAKGEAQALASEAKGHAQDLFHQVRSETTSQLSTQQQRLADAMRTVSGELDQMAHGAQTSTASGLVSQAAGQVDNVARWLEQREPADVLDEVRRYARRNPGTFLAGAALLGLIGGRLTRGLQADSAREDTRRYPARPAGYTGGTGYVETSYPRQERTTTEVYDQEVTPAVGTTVTGTTAPLGTETGHRGSLPERDEPWGSGDVRR
ncbi:hypothetical protein [Arsenicicoccus sp. oral taxon 190]|uniref:hypothetical protein n=1 Tax=Arsenicicoccus sp. oral taxon 190 TaxID=1658671 RepID=UPI00067E2A1A|nr:hypothetical protein [Arsenicicoccus sp. oral taxon 190]